MPDYSQGSTVMFGDSPIGSVLSIAGSPGSASFADITSATTAVIGSLEDARIIKESTVLVVDPGSVTVRLLGMPPYSRADIGSRGTLTFNTNGGSLSFEAFLETFEVEASVGELLKGSCTFRFSGA